MLHTCRFGETYARVCLWLVRTDVIQVRACVSARALCMIQKYKESAGLLSLYIYIYIYIYIYYILYIYIYIYISYIAILFHL